MDNADHIPQPRPGYRLEAMGDDILLYGTTALKTIYLNESAALVWKLCDGARSVRQIAEVLVRSYPEDAAAVEGDVWNTIDRLLREGALRLGPPTARGDETAAGAG